ncbi:hypothetical protein RIF29_18194 [Crotalaria pallida]|uniref:Uncharacterized protein n=1 Tax=Crotalaria pallida TaxID=3830 RepID=A0AAN9IH58_CROPI
MLLHYKVTSVVILLHAPLFFLICVCAIASIPVSVYNISVSIYKTRLCLVGPNLLTRGRERKENILFLCQRNNNMAAAAAAAAAAL